MGSIALVKRLEKLWDDLPRERQHSLLVRRDMRQRNRDAMWDWVADERESYLSGQDSSNKANKRSNYEIGDNTYSSD